jgi:hypothetical protein
VTGVFVTRGMTVVIPAGGATLTFSDNGKPTNFAITAMHVHYDVCPTWLELAARHLSDAIERKHARITAWESNDDGAKSATLEKEFESSMQAIMAAAIAVDSFYATLKGKTKIADETFKAWKRNGTARYVQIAEVLKAAFSLKQQDFDKIRCDLEQIFKLRDLAIHPEGAPEFPVLHPELKIALEWRFEVFRADKVEPLVREVRSIIHRLVIDGNPSTPDIKRYIEGLRTLITLD